RRAQQAQGDYVLGEGDLISVKAYDLDDLNQRVRVENDGSVTLPLLNRVSVAGRTVSEVQADFTKRLGAFMFSPHVTVFVEEYRSQQVAVEAGPRQPAGSQRHRARRPVGGGRHNRRSREPPLPDPGRDARLCRGQGAA